jgi:hypothetical protein
MTWFCLIDEGLQTVLAGTRLRQRGPLPTVAESAVLTMEVVGAYLGLAQESVIFASFRRPSRHFFPALRHLHRTTCVRQAANLPPVQDRLWQGLREQIPSDPHPAIVDRLALPVCQFTRAPRCRRLHGEATSGQEHLTHLPFYGFRVLHARLCWPGVLCQIEVTPGNGQDLTAAEDLTEGTSGLVSGDRHVWAPRLREQLASRGLQLLAPFCHRQHDPWPRLSRALFRWRSRIETIFGQLVERTTLKRSWAHDLWYLTSRLLRKVLMHTLAVLTNVSLGHPPLHLAALAV